MDSVVQFFAFLGAIGLYFIPSIVASHRNHHNTIPILLVNVFLDWTFLGWVLALVWSTTRVES